MSRSLRLILQGLTLRVRLGLESAERVSARSVRLDLVWRGSFDGSIPTVDYSRLCDLLQTLEDGEFSYIEELTTAVLDLLESRWPGQWSVSVSKTYPPVDLPLDRVVCTMEGDGI